MAAIILRLMKVEVATIKKSTNIRYRNDWMDFRKDGIEPKERIKDEYNISLYNICDKYYDYLFKIREILSEERLLAPEKVDRIQSVIDKFNNYTDNYVKSKIEKWSSHE